MSKAQSEAQQKRWAKVPKQTRSAIMSEVVKHRFAKMTDAERSAHGKKVRSASLKRGH